ncbi:MAG: hypothetical protein AAB557_05025 [Patescibacteria group bacterium]
MIKNRPKISTLAFFIVSTLILVGMVTGVQQSQEIRKKAAPASSLFFDPPAPVAQINQSFTVTPMIDPGNNIISALELFLEYDPQTIQLDTIAPSSNFSVILRQAVIDNTSGRASIIIGTPPLTPARTTTAVASLSMRAKSITGITTLTFGNGTKAAALDETQSAIVSMRPATISLVAPTQTPTPTPTNTPAPTPTPIPGDINHNGRVDIYDYNNLVEVFGRTGSYAADLDANGRVDIFDYNILVANFGKSL